jgi:DNA-binding MarR family transcriptional regulator
MIVLGATIYGMASSPNVAVATRSNQPLVLIHHLAAVARRSSELALEPLGLRPRHIVALTILRDHGAMTQGALGEALRLDPANLVGLLNELEQRALLERRRDPDDRRRHIVELSSGGRAALANAEGALASVGDDVLSGLDDDERCTLHRLLMRAAEKQIGGDPCVEAANESATCIEAADELSAR